MKKTFSNFRTLAALLMAGAAFAACSSDDSIIENQQPANPGEQVYTLTIKASNGDATTRALDLDGTALKATWAEGDVLYVVKGTSPVGTLSPKSGTISVDGKSATFTGTVAGVSVNDELTLTYHPITSVSDFESQDGTLKGTKGAEKYDMATATVTVASINEGNITTTDDASFTTKTAMLKLTLTDGTNAINATSLNVKASLAGGAINEDLLTFTIPAGTYTTNGDGILYFSLPSAAIVANQLAAKYSATLTPATALAALNLATITFTAEAGGNTYTVDKTGYKFAEGKYYAATLTMAEVPAGNTIDLSTVTVATTAQDGDVLTGTLDNNVQISIADGATVILNNVSINADGTWKSSDYAGLTCLGDATIVLSGTNTVRGFTGYYPGLQAGPAGTTLTIKGTGSLTAREANVKYPGASGIGAARMVACGNIVIEGGDITATGGYSGIGGAFGYSGGEEGTCGDITITGGTVTATALSYGAGIGAGRGEFGSCGNITISGGTVTAIATAKNSVAAAIGAGSLSSTCTSVTIGTGITSLTMTNGHSSATGIVSNFLNATDVYANTTPITTMLSTSVTDATITTGMTLAGFATSYNEGTKTWTVTKK